MGQSWACQHANPRLTKNQETMLSILHGAGAAGLTTEQWNEQARSVDIGTKRKADLYDIREKLKSKELVRQYGEKMECLLTVQISGVASFRAEAIALSFFPTERFSA